MGFQKSCVIFGVGQGKCLRPLTRWVGGVKKGQKHAYIIFQWSLIRVCERLTHTLLQRTLYSKETLCIVTSCSKEQFASNWLVTVCSKTHFTPQHTLPPGMFFFLEHFAPQPPLLPRTFFSLAQFAS